MDNQDCLPGQCIIFKIPLPFRTFDNVVAKKEKFLRRNQITNSKIRNCFDNKMGSFRIIDRMVKFESILIITKANTIFFLVF